ncbi:helix-turn-helix domain-containing protein [Curtobacterium sp. MCBA15_001]|uniref:AraC family transcriptional regulator n=1 Tax=Curtobacterium sp. MCBA15_001 TaxID=1898731 RepID=UPI0008DEA5C3|nr:helix-turn-helix domain-containing protein [Curtobacterium sp. MCBA15_001]OIH97234.1 hypothetical protein BIU90_14985 [Curtobacterium sp. MCBA15_001]
MPDLLPPRKGAILAPGAERWVGTDAHVHREPRVDQPPVGGVSLASADTHHGTVHVGPLFDEVVRLPDLFTTTTHHDAHHDVDTDVLLALEHLGSVAAVRWPCPARDALAQLVVVSLLMTWQVPVLDDRSLTRCFDAIADAERSIPTTALPALARMSRSTLTRRFRATTGLTPDEFRRWVRTLEIRTQLHLGHDPGAVARRHGSASVRALVRVVERVERTTERRPQSGAGSVFEH